jgi:hypothetical protein
LARLHFNQAETFLDPIKTGIDAIDTNGDIGELNLQVTGALRQLEHPTIHHLELLANRAQVLEYKIFRFGHHRSLAQIHFHFDA